MRLSAQAKGAGMISPNFATMLCFVQTDAALSPETADLLLGVTVKRSFDRISVDGQLSTNDTVILMASGASGVRVEPESPTSCARRGAGRAAAPAGAGLIVRDGEGAKRVGRVVVRGGDGEQGRGGRARRRELAARKAALHGGDPNWGGSPRRSAARCSTPRRWPRHRDRGRAGVRGGRGVPYDERALAEAVPGDEVEYAIGLPGEAPRPRSSSPTSPTST